MHFYVSSFSAAASMIVLVLHISCFTGNIAALHISGDSSTTIKSDDIIFTTVPSATDRIVVNEELSQGETLLDVNETSTDEKLQHRPEEYNTDETPVIKKLHQGDITLSVDGVHVTEKSQPEVLYDVNKPSSTESEESEESYDENENSGSRWVQKIQKVQMARSRSLEAPAKNTTTQNHSGKPVTFGQVIANVLYGAPWPTSQANSKCANDMRLYNLHMQNFTLWAAKMLDATSKGPEGLLDGNTFSFGNFEQCMGVKSKNLGITGGYTLVDIDFQPNVNVYPAYYDNDHSQDYHPDDDDQSAWEALKHNIQDDYVQRHKFQWAVCLPDTCESEDVQKIVRNVLIPELNRHGMDGNVSTDPVLHTSNKNIFKYSVGFYLVCAMFVGVSLLVFAGTLYDFAYLQYTPKSEHGPMKKFMKPFSLISNLERLLKPSESEEFSIINGLKVCAILQVIVGHRWFIEFGNPQYNPNFTHWVIHFFWLGYFKCNVFLETFFVISGFLTFYLITQQLITKKRLNFIPIMIYRWLRIFPVYATLIATYIFILPYLNDGPYWKMIIYRESERCQKNWWTNVLFINNYVNTDELCIIPSWYLACDMHFFIVGTLLTYVIWKWRKVGLILLGTCLTLSTIIPAYIIFKEEYWATNPISPESLKDLSKERFYTKVYIKSHMRSMTYFVGILAGYLYMKLKDADYKLSLKSRIIWAPIVLFIGNCIYLSSGTFFMLGHQYEVYEHVLYFTFNRLVWSILISYGIIGHGLSGFGVCLSGFLGHRVFHVLGKLVFCIYMYQEIIQLQTIASMKTPTYQSLTLMAWRFGGDTFMAIMYAFAINVMVESPFDRVQKNLMKIFVGDAFSKSKQKPQTETENIENKNGQLTA